MEMDVPNLQGANLRQVVVNGDHAAQLQQQGRRDGADFQVRLGAAMVEKTLRARDQTDSPEMVVHRQEDQAEFSTGDTLNGGGGGGGHRDDPPSNSDSNHDSGHDQIPGIAWLDDIDSAIEQWAESLRSSDRHALEASFRGIDRNTLAGLVERPSHSGADQYRRQSVLTAVPSDLVRQCLESGLREAIHLATGIGDVDRLRKFLSLARQGSRIDSPLGALLSRITGHLLLEFSRQTPDSNSRGLGILAGIVGYWRDWRQTNSGGILPRWNRG